MAGNLAASLNGDSQSAAIDRSALDAALREQGPEFFESLTERPHLFSNAVFFVSAAQLAQMRNVIAAVESIVRLPKWQILPTTGQVNALGVFYGYDFHLNAEGAHLIEINTNAGGAFLNALLQHSQRDAHIPGTTFAPNTEQAFLDMFRNEWRLERGAAPLATIAIVDEQPQQQYLYPEFLLAQRMFERAGINTFIADPAALEARADGLYCADRRIDLVYNRLTDFALQQHTALRGAYENNQIVLTPHPQAYACYADKRNLARLSDATALRALGAETHAISALQAGLPLTREVHGADREQWWNERKQWFFKPATGFGAKAAYRGEKVTHRVFDEIMQHDYVAQKFAAPGERMINVGEAGPAPYKSDVRCYVYDGNIQLIAARLYQGQTTNFRTPGGGFALVRIVD
ncbi:MAG TPA: hypothetical protein VIU46_09985 [Gallionellaceae bacterium]